MQLSIIIVNYNVKYFLAQALVAAQKAANGMEYEIIVVDNNSTDDSIAYLKPLFKEVIFIENKSNPGFGVANNQAAAIAKGKYLLILNPDTILTEQTLTDSLNQFERERLTGAIGVKMLTAKGAFLPESKRGFPSPWVSFCKTFGLNALFPQTTLFGGYHLQYLSPDLVHQVEVLAGAYMMIPTELYRRIGGFDEQFFMYGEDIDLSYRITQEGYHNYYLPTPIIHFKGESTKTESLHYVKVFYEAMEIFYHKHYRLDAYWMQLLVQIGIGARATIATLRRILLTASVPSTALSAHSVIVVMAPDSEIEAIKSLLSNNGQQVSLQLHSMNPDINICLRDCNATHLVIDTSHIPLYPILEWLHANSGIIEVLYYNSRTRTIVSTDVVYH